MWVGEAVREAAETDIDDAVRSALAGLENEFNATDDDAGSDIIGLIDIESDK